jgi:hypothetical protein
MFIIQKAIHQSRGTSKTTPVTGMPTHGGVEK